MRQNSSGAGYEQDDVFRGERMSLHHPPSTNIEPAVVEAMSAIPAVSRLSEAHLDVDGNSFPEYTIVPEAARAEK